MKLVWMTLGTVMLGLLQAAFFVGGGFLGLVDVVIVGALVLITSGYELEAVVVGFASGVMVDLLRREGLGVTSLSVSLALVVWSLLRTLLGSSSGWARIVFPIVAIAVYEITRAVLYYFVGDLLVLPEDILWRELLRMAVAGILFGLGTYLFGHLRERGEKRPFIR